jgi:hypothetical protein
MIEEVDAELTARLSADKVAEVIDLVPDSWLEGDPGFDGATQQRQAYLDFFKRRLRSSNLFVQEAVHARSSHL